MTADLRSQLESSLGTAYQLDRELGGGGMSRVFVAREVALGRNVVVKVMSPELAAGVNVDRFNREIQLAAKLQHPHIVPVLSAGASGDLPFYTMPFVDGETLRDRLSRSGELPVADACRIFREVADALATAHANGVVHRDIKPENILLSGQHALVADFGVAKALSTAVRSGGALTDIGLALGTPMYMAPEQAAAEPNVDHRADIYALGVVAYEMFAGRAPFAGRSLQALLAAQMTERPVDIATLRPTMPARLADLVMRCLEKIPADRPQTAAEVITEIDGASATPSSTLSVRPGAQREPARTSGVAWTSRRMLLRVAGALLLLVVAGAAYLGNRAWRTGDWLLFGSVLKERDKVVVAEFGHPGTDSTLGAVVSSALRTDIGQSKVITVAQSADLADVLRRMQRPPNTRLTPEVAREIALREGFKVVVEGDIAKIGEGYVLTARLVSAATGEVLASFRETAKSSADIIPAIDKLSSEVRHKIGESVKDVAATPPLANVTTSSIDALRKYVQAQNAMDNRSDYTRAFALLDEAIALDSNFAAAYSAYAIYLYNRQLRPVLAETMRRKAYLLRDRLTEAERYRATGAYFSNVGAHYDFQRSLAAYKSLMELDSSSSLPYNEIGQLYRFQRDPAHAAEYYAQALKRDSTETVLYSNLGAMLFSLGRTEEANAVFAQMAKRFPDDPVVLRRLADYAFARLLLDSAEIYAKRMLELRPGEPIWRGEANAVLLASVTMKGKLRERERMLNTFIANNRANHQPGEVFRFRLNLALTDIRHRHDPKAALAKVRAALKDYPPDSTGRLRQYNQMLATTYAMAGRPDLAREVMARAKPMFDTISDPRAQRMLEDTRGDVALGDNRTEEALEHYRRADVGMCRTCLLPSMALTYDRAGQVDSAIALYERYVNTPEIAIPNWSLSLPQALHRLGELYEARGDAAKAEEYYSRFVELWKDADPELQPQVNEARRRIQVMRRRTG